MEQSTLYRWVGHLARCRQTCHLHACMIDHSFACLQIWDTAGQERFRALRTPFYRGSDVCLLAYAINDRNSFRGLMKWHEEFLKYADVRDSRFPFIVVGNKVSSRAAAGQSTEIQLGPIQFAIAERLRADGPPSDDRGGAGVVRRISYSQQYRDFGQDGL